MEKLETVVFENDSVLKLLRQLGNFVSGLLNLMYTVVKANDISSGHSLAFTTVKRWTRVRRGAMHAST